MKSGRSHFVTFGIAAVVGVGLGLGANLLFYSRSWNDMVFLGRDHLGINDNGPEGALIAENAARLELFEFGMRAFLSLIVVVAAFVVLLKPRINPVAKHFATAAGTAVITYWFGHGVK